MTNCAASFKQRNSFRSLTSFIICIPDMLVVHRKNKHKHTSQNQNICSSKPPCRPTHPRRVRPETAGPVDHISSFQSTRPRGVRHERVMYDPDSRDCFNPRTREGCDVAFHVVSCFGFLFQSTHPRGVRPKCCKPCFEEILFQSTHPQGVRPVKDAIQQRRTAVSIHAPARGATSAPSSRKSDVQRFNPRTREGCDVIVEPGEAAFVVSIHAPARGAT